MTGTTQHFPRIVLTPGEPAGIGPDVSVAVASRDGPVRLVAVADPAMLTERARVLGHAVTIRTLADDEPVPDHRAGVLCVRPVATAVPCRAGRLDTANAAYVLETLLTAVRGCLAGHYDAMVTAPVHKGVINDAGVPFTGHTEFLAAETGSRLPVMLLCAASLRVALVTTHLPLRDVPDAITADRIDAICRVLAGDLARRFGIERPQILVCGLNPHAGEGGHFGREDLDVIAPAIERLRADGLRVNGPVPADTAFTPAAQHDVAAVLCMYHDQGLPVIKAIGFGHAVNVTLGLPIVRTSVDHGTALALAATGDADPGSLEAALDLAARLAPRPPAVA